LISKCINQVTKFAPTQCFCTHHQANAVIDQVTGQSYEYEHLVTGKVTAHTTKVWTRSLANELRKLANGIGTCITKDTKAIFFINCNPIPNDRKITYSWSTCTIHYQTQETHHTCLATGSNLIGYPHSVSTPSANITTTKIVFNSAVSIPNGKFIGFDMKDFYLITKMARYEYMRLPLDIIPQEIIDLSQIIDQYNLLLPLVHKGDVYIKICKGMY
jgi:hypothetical protein